MAVRLLKLMEELNKLGTTIIMATHNEGLVRDFGHPRIMIDSGRVEQLPGLQPHRSRSLRMEGKVT